MQMEEDWNKEKKVREIERKEGREGGEEAQKKLHSLVLVNSISPVLHLYPLFLWKDMGNSLNKEHHVFQELFASDFASCFHPAQTQTQPH